MTTLTSTEWLARRCGISVDELRAQLAKPDGYIMIPPGTLLICPNDPRLIWPPRKRP